MAPIVVKNIVFAGNSGGELGVRGRLTAMDLKSGKILWTAYNSGSDSDALIGANFKPFYAKDQGKDLGISTWNPGQWKMGGGTVWGWISYDPESESDLLRLRKSRRMEPGHAARRQQMVHHHLGARSGQRSGQMGLPGGASRRLGLRRDHGEHPGRHAVAGPHAQAADSSRTHRLHVCARSRNGTRCSRLRNTSRLIGPTSYDLKTGLPDINPEKRTHFGKYATHICPSSTGAKDFIPSAFSPRTGLLYIPAHNTCMDYEGTR